MIESTFVCTHEIKACWGLESRNMVSRVSRKKAREATRMGNFPPSSIDSFHVRESGPRHSSSLLPSYSKCHRPMSVRVPSASADDQADRPRACSQRPSRSQSELSARARWWIGAITRGRKGSGSRCIRSTNKALVIIIDNHSPWSRAGHDQKKNN